MFHLSNFHTGILFICMCAAGAASAKLPAPSPEQLAVSQAAKGKAAADAAVELAALTKAQDRIAADYIQRQQANGITVKPTLGLGTAAAEVPSAALNSRPMEKAGAYNESVTPATAPGATTGAKGKSASTPQTKEAGSR